LKLLVKLVAYDQQVLKVSSIEVTCKTCRDTKYISAQTEYY